MTKSNETASLDFIADKDLDDPNDDDFQRYEFSARIAKTIVTRKSSDCIVYGIYGAWGEGKSTVLNFIEREIREQNPKVILFKFNPWRFGDETSLLTNFFHGLATQIAQFSKQDGEVASNGKQQTSNKALNKWWEDVAQTIDQYGIASVGKVFLPEGITDVVGKFTKTIGEVDVQTLKSRLDALLKNNCKIIIFIDDIDRLEKSEVHAIFRLVKLNANFVNTTYVLSFDEDMVAAAVGERFGSGDKLSGKSFLEKIIQVPLTLPKAPTDKLEKYCYTFIDKILAENEIKLSEEESLNFALNFRTALLPRLVTPRTAVRYANAIAFYLPLVAGEVNVVDFLLIEGLKIFYPKHYRCVRENPDYFLGIYSLGPTAKIADEDHRERQQILMNLSVDLSAAERNAVLGLLNFLFPLITDYLHSNSPESRILEKWKNGKHIKSRDYFQRYFSYTVLLGEISDVEFELLMNDFVLSSNIVEIEQKIQSLIRNSSDEKFINRLSEHIGRLNWNASRIVISTLVVYGADYSRIGSEFLGYLDSVFKKAASLIANILFMHRSETNLIEFTVELLGSCENFDFAYEIMHQCRLGSKPEDRIFSPDELDVLMSTLADRLIHSSGENTIFKSFPRYTYQFGPWLARNRQEFFAKYINSFLNREQINVIHLISAFVSTTPVEVDKEPERSDLTSEIMKDIATIVDLTIIKASLIELFTQEVLNSQQPEWDNFHRAGKTDINLARQFLYLLQNMSQQ